MPGHSRRGANTLFQSRDAVWIEASEKSSRPIRRSVAGSHQRKPDGRHPRRRM